MATCTRNALIVITPPPATYTLTLSEDEARTLRNLIGHSVFGVGAPTRAATGVYEALINADVPYTEPMFTGRVHA